jgi:hypothetical protein
MGYDFHITRAESWVESESNPISSGEWLTIVNSDPELKIDERNGPYFACWAGPCSYPDGGWFDWRDGEIYTKNPDRQILKKMLHLANKLSAKVCGDEDELYSSETQIDL